MQDYQRAIRAPLARCVPKGSTVGFIALTSSHPKEDTAATPYGNRYRSVCDDPRLAESQDDSFSQFTSSCFNDGMKFGARQSIRVPKTGDAIDGVTLEVTLPALSGNRRWRDDIVETVLQSIVFRVESSPIYTATGYLNAALCAALGKFPTHAAARYNALLEQDQIRHCAQPWSLIIPLALPPMWQNGNAFAVPGYSYFHVDVQLERFAALVVDDYATNLSEMEAEANLQVLVQSTCLSTDINHCLWSAPIHEEENRRVTVCRKELAVAVKPSLREGIVALKHWFAHVELSEHNRSVAYRAGLLDMHSRAGLLDSSVERPNLDYYLAHCGETLQRIAQTLLLKPEAKALWTRFCAPELAVVQSGKGVRRNAPTNSKSAAAVGEPLSGISFIPTLQYATFDLECGSAQVFNLDFFNPCAGLILAFSAKNAFLCEADPFESIQLMVGGCEQQACTYTQAREWNWMQCDAKALPQRWQHMCILPFSQYALKWIPGGFPCTIDMRWCGANSLVVTPPLCSNVRWTMHVGAISQNQYMEMDGMAAMRYTR